MTSGVTVINDLFQLVPTSPGLPKTNGGERKGRRREIWRIELEEESRKGKDEGKEKIYKEEEDERET